MTKMSMSLGGKITTDDYLEKSELKRINSRKSIVPLNGKHESSTSIVSGKPRNFWDYQKRKTLAVTIDDAERNRNISRLSLEAGVIPEQSDQEEDKSPKLRVGGYYHEMQERNAKLKSVSYCQRNSDIEKRLKKFYTNEHKTNVE